MLKWLGYWEIYERPWGLYLISDVLGEISYDPDPRVSFESVLWYLIVRMKQLADGSNNAKGAQPLGFGTRGRGPVGVHEMGLPAVTP